MRINSSRTIKEAIDRAERILPGKLAADGKNDPRWQAIIRVGEYIETEPEAVWLFTLRWGKHAQADLRAAVATCLLEHLLDHHFDLIFPKVEAAASKSRRFAKTFNMCWQLGSAANRSKRVRIKRLKAQLGRPRLR